MPSADPSPFAVLLAAASGGSVPSDQLARAAQVLATAIADSGMVTWCQTELNGYETIEVPDYRKAAATLHAVDAYGRTLPVHSKDPDFLKSMSECPIIQPLSLVEQMAAGSGNAEFKVMFLPHVAARLMNSMRGVSDIFRIVQGNAFQAAQAGARHHIFNWAMRHIDSAVTLPGGLTMASLLGTTAAQERMPEPGLEAPSGFNLNGPMTGVTIQMNSPSASATTTATVTTQALDPEALKALAEAFAEVTAKATTAGVPAGECAALEQAIQELRHLSGIQKPNFGWIRTSLLSVKAILENATGGMLVELAKPHALPLLVQALRNVGIS